MSNRRDFLVQAATAGGLLALQQTQTALAQTATRSSKPLRILILGATGHVGPHFVNAALERGHRVSAFIRKDRRGPRDELALPKQAALPAKVEQLFGDRNGNLASIQNREWDAVMDVATYGPVWVKTLGEALRGRVRHYTFISSDAVYVLPASKDATGFHDETSKLAEYTGSADPYSPKLALMPKNPDPSFQYAALKVLCEREAERQFPRKTLILRPSGITGPNDKMGAITYLAVRMDLAGEILATGDPLGPVQYIDVRDMAEWAVRMAEAADTGVYNCTGPAGRLGLAEMLGAFRGTVSRAVSLTWVPMQWLNDQKVLTSDFDVFRYWQLLGETGLSNESNAKAIAHGLTFRPVGVLATDMLAWYKRTPAELREQALASVEESMKLEAQLLKAWHAGPGRGK